MFPEELNIIVLEYINNHYIMFLKKSKINLKKMIFLITNHHFFHVYNQRQIIKIQYITEQ